MGHLRLHSLRHVLEETVPSCIQTVREKVGRAVRRKFDDIGAACSRANVEYDAH